PDSSGTPRVAVTRNAPLAGAPVVQVAAGEPTRLQAGRELGRSECSVRGQIAADAKPQVLRVAVHDPALAAASLLLAAMNDAGISVAGGAAVGAAAQDSQVLSTHTSPPLAAIVQPLLSNSDNLYAEQ